MNSTYMAQTSTQDSTGTSKNVSAVPERFRSGSAPVVGRSVVPKEFSSSSAPQQTTNQIVASLETAQNHADGSIGYFHYLRDVPCAWT